MKIEEYSEKKWHLQWIWAPFWASWKTSVFVHQKKKIVYTKPALRFIFVFSQSKRTRTVLHSFHQTFSIVIEKFCSNIPLLFERILNFNIFAFHKSLLKVVSKRPRSFSLKHKIIYNAKTASAVLDTVVTYNWYQRYDSFVCPDINDMKVSFVPHRPRIWGF